MTHTIITKSLIIWICLTLFGCASMGTGSVEEKREAIISMSNETLQKLYSEKPDTRAQIQQAPGYAVFSNANINFVLFAAGAGYGLVKNTRTGKQTYMNMAEGGLGVGLGAKDYRIIMVFHSESALNHFINNGWAVGGNADAAAKAGDKGASIEGESYAGNVTVYTITEAGLALQATIKGTKFWVDAKLN